MIVRIFKESIVLKGLYRLKIHGLRSAVKQAWFIRVVDITNNKEDITTQLYSKFKDVEFTIKSIE